MPQTTVAAIQMTCVADPAQNLAHAEELVRQAAAKGAQIVLLPELFERPYFCQERRYEYYDYALPLEENPAVRRFAEVCRELELVMPVSFYEKGRHPSVQQRCHAGRRRQHPGSLPQDPYPRTTIIIRKSSISPPGNTRFQSVRYPGTAGSGWASAGTQWFPETARCLALAGADLILYPTAIGSEPILEVDSAGHWQRDHAGAMRLLMCSL